MGWYEVECARHQNSAVVEFGFDGKVIQVPISDFIYTPAAASDICVLSVVPSKLGVNYLGCKI
jgi:hypothetical protein